MPQRKGLSAPQNTFLDTIATRFDGTHSNFVLGNAEAKDYPIVYCSDGFLLLTKYSRANIMSRGSECRFLWGVDTTEEERMKISNSFNNRKELKTELYLYKRTGEKFQCLLDVVPIKNEKGQVVLFLVSHKDLTPKESKKVNNDSKTSSLTENEKSIDFDECSEEIEEIQTTSKYQRRRSRAVLYNLQGQYNGKRKSKRKLHRFQKFNGAESLPEYKVDEMKKSYFIFQHYGPIKIIWDWLLLIATFYVALMVPYHAAVQRPQDNKNSGVTDIIVEILFILDVVFNFRTTYVNKSGQIVYDQRKIAINYLKGWFIVDLIAAIPFDIINELFERQAHATKPQIHLMKLTRMLRLARLMQKIDRYYQYSAIVLALLIGMFGLCAHWLACVWYYIGTIERGNNNTRLIGWMYELSFKINKPYSSNGTGGPEISNYFITALYFTCSSLTSVGFGNVSANTDAEKLFSICVMLMGALMHAAIFGNITALIQRMYSRRTAYQSKHRDLKEFIRTHRIPKKLKRRILEFFQTMWALNHGIDGDEVLKDFSDGLKGDIAIHLNREILGLKIFEKASQGCLKSLAQKIKTAFCTPGEYLVHSGDIIHYIYFVCSGSLEILENNEVVALLGKNDWFGTYVHNVGSHEIIRSKCDVKALTYCDLQCIELVGLYQVFTLYPGFRHVFSKFLCKDLSFNIQEGVIQKIDCESSTNSGITVLPSISEDDDEYSVEEESDNVLEEQNSHSHSDEKLCLIQEASNSDHMLNSLKIQEKKRMKQERKSKEDSQTPTLNKKIDVESKIFRMPEIEDKIEIDLQHKEFQKSDVAKNRRRSFELSRKRQAAQNIFSNENRSGSDSSLENSKWQKSFRYELNGMKKHLERLENNFIQMGQTMLCMNKNMEEILTHIINQNVAISENFVENSTSVTYYPRTVNNKHLRKPFHYNSFLKVTSTSPIDENEERQNIWLADEQLDESEFIEEDELIKKPSILIDNVENVNPSMGPFQRPPDIFIQSPQINESSLLNINNYLLESKLSPRSISSGFVSNQEDNSPKSSQCYLDTLKSVKLPQNNETSVNFATDSSSIELDHKVLMQKINQICRMQSLPESSSPPSTTHALNILHNSVVNDTNDPKYFTHRRISSPIPFIRSTNL